jgi:hypothetical protein
MIKNEFGRFEALKYEMYGSWWSRFAPQLQCILIQDLIGRYFAWKVNRKYDRYLKYLNKHKAFAPNDPE